jgi:hypothetical protein
LPPKCSAPFPPFVLGENEDCIGVVNCSLVVSDEELARFLQVGGGSFEAKRRSGAADGDTFVGVVGIWALSGDVAIPERVGRGVELSVPGWRAQAIPIPVGIDRWRFGSVHATDHLDLFAGCNGYACFRERVWVGIGGSAAFSGLLLEVVAYVAFYSA